MAKAKKVSKIEITCPGCGAELLLNPENGDYEAYAKKAKKETDSSNDAESDSRKENGTDTTTQKKDDVNGDQDDKETGHSKWGIFGDW